MIFSIHSRILISAFIVLTLFMSLTAIVLDNAFINNIKNLQHENLRTQVYSLLAAADIDDNGLLHLPEEVTEPRLNITDSNLHAQIVSIDDTVVWQSKSMLNLDLSFSSKIKMAEFLFSTKTKKTENYTLVNFTTIWITDSGEIPYVIQVAENNKTLDNQINNFRNNLWFWLAGVSLLLIVVQTIILRWGLKPLRHIAEDLIKIEQGQAENLSGRYPKEISPLTNNLNQLLLSSNQQLIRYRDALGNMAHSMKTPIAVLQGIVNGIKNEDKNTAIEQLSSINNIVDYQLQRAATAGKRQNSTPINLKNITDKLLATLNKVYKDKNINIIINIKNGLLIKIDEGDLLELLGNLIENAYKWCHNQVSVSAYSEDSKVIILIEDDGPGISEEKRKNILLRGQRADQSTPGHGLGLAMVSDTLLLYDGTLNIKTSHLGGAKITVKI